MGWLIFRHEAAAGWMHRGGMAMGGGGVVFAACTAKRACLCASAGLCCLASHCFGPVDALLSHALPPRPPRRQPITARWPAGALAHRHGTRHHPFRGYPTLPVGVSVCVHVDAPRPVLMLAHRALLHSRPATRLCLSTPSTPARTMATKPSLAAAEDFLSFVNASPTRMSSARHACVASC